MNDPNFLLDLWASAKQAGPFATMLMVYLWYLERKDRLKLQGERDALLERVLTIINTMSISLTTVGASVERLYATVEKLANVVLRRTPDEQ